MASSNDSPAHPEPAASDRAVPVGLEFKVPKWKEWSYRVESDKKNEANAKRFKEAASSLELQAPAGHGHKFETLRFLFGWDKYDEYWNLKSYAGCEGNILTIEDFLEARGVKQLVEDKTVCDSIVYYDWAGNEIDEATAFEWSKNMHPSKKPPSQRPGKRASSSPPGPSSGPGPSPGSPAKQPKA
jgi:hypothetical protein